MDPKYLDVNVLTQFSALGRLSKPLAEGAQALLVRAGSIAQEFKRLADTVQKSEALTQIGKSVEMRKLYGETSKQLETLRGEAQGYLKNADSIAAKMQPKAGNIPMDERIITEMRRREIRDQLRDRDQVQVKFLYQEAVQEGWDDLAVALEESPQGFAMVPPEIVAVGVQARLERQNPEAAAQVAELRTAHESVNFVIDQIRKESEKLAGIADPSLEAVESLIGGRP